LTEIKERLILVGPMHTRLSAQNWEESVEGWYHSVKGQSCPLFWESMCCFAFHAYLCVTFYHHFILSSFTV
jgi:hypothetical protein